MSSYTIVWTRGAWRDVESMVDYCQARQLCIRACL